MHGGKNVLWVPSEYRAMCSSVCRNNIAIGVGSGKVWTFSHDLDELHGDLPLRSGHYGEKVSVMTGLKKIESPTNTPRTIQQALRIHDMLALKKLLEHDFDRVAQDEYKWLHELDEVGYSRTDIAVLLFEEANDAPWIYFSARDRICHEQDIHHPTSIPSGPSDIMPFSSPWTSERHEVKRMVQQLCGLGGVAPISRSLNDWNGEVVFRNNYSDSWISYATSSKGSGCAEPSVVLSRLK